jgi:hypothetical protein
MKSVGRNLLLNFPMVAINLMRTMLRYLNDRIPESGSHTLRDHVPLTLGDRSQNRENELACRSAGVNLLAERDDSRTGFSGRSTNPAPHALQG